MDTIQQEKQLGRIDDTSRETNPYKELIVNNAEKVEPLMTQMEQWSILSNVLNYVQHSRFNSMNHTLDVKAMNRYKSKPDVNREVKELDFGATPQKLQEEYMDIYERIHSDIVSSNRFNENSDISTTYLGKIENNRDKLKAEESFPISGNGYTLGRLLDGTKCQLSWTQAWVNPLCHNHFTYDPNLFTPYQSLHQPHKEYKLEMVSVLVCCL